MKACQTWNGVLLISPRRSHKTGKRIACRDRNAQLWRGLGFCCVAQHQIAFLFPPTPHPRLSPCGYTPSISQQLPSLIPFMLLMPQKDWTDRFPSADGSSSLTGIRAAGWKPLILASFKTLECAASSTTTKKRVSQTSERWDVDFAHEILLIDKHPIQQILISLPRMMHMQMCFLA